MVKSDSEARVSRKPTPRWARRYCSREELERLEARIEAFEKKWGVEAVTVLAQRSSSVGHVFWVALLGLWCVLLSAEQFFHAALWWHTLLAALCVPLAWGLSRLAFIQRLLTSDFDELTQVRWVAEHHFLTSGFQDAGRPVLLLMVSLMEHQTVVLTDPRLRERFKENGFDETRIKNVLDQCVAILVQKSRLNQPLEAFQNALDQLERDLGPALLNPPAQSSGYALCNGLRFYPSTV